MSGGVGDIPAVVGGCLKASLDHLAFGRGEAAVETIAAGAVADIQQCGQAFLKDASRAAFLGDLYARAFDMAGLRRGEATAAGRGPWRVVYVIGSVVEGQAASANVARLVEGQDRAVFEPRVVVTEEFTARRPGLTFLRFPDAPSERVGSATLARMRRGARVGVVEARGSLLEGAAAAREMIAEMAPDIAVFVGSPACPIQAALAYTRVAGTQVNMNIGVPLLVPGMDAVIYNNPARREADRAVLAGRGVMDLGVETSGGDAAGGARAGVADRASMGVPGEAVLLCSAASRLGDRMVAGGFAADLGAFLGANPGVWWVGVGGGDVARARGVLAARGEGVLARAVFVGPQADIRPVVKASDVYLNEYPEGGGNSVIEAMGCGVPVAAMRAGSRHAECIGAMLVGEDAVGIADAGAYWGLVGRWCGSAGLRRGAGERQRARALSRLDYSVIVRAYEGEMRRALAREAEAVSRLCCPTPW